MKQYSNSLVLLEPLWHKGCHKIKKNKNIIRKRSLKKEERKEKKKKDITYKGAMIVVTDFLSETMKPSIESNRVSEVMGKKKNQTRFYTQKEYLSNMRVKAIAIRSALHGILSRF